MEKVLAVKSEKVLLKLVWAALPFLPHLLALTPFNSKEPFGTISVKIRVKRPGTNFLLAIYSAVPVANDNHYSTQ